MCTTRVIYESAEVGYDNSIGLAGAYVVKVNGKFEPIHGIYNGKPYWICKRNHNKVFLIGDALEALERIIDMENN